MEPQVERRSGKDRRVRRRYRFHDLRSGYDRRCRYPVLGTLSNRPWALVTLLVLLNLMSMLDGVLTTGELLFGIAREGNPVLVNALMTSPLYAAFFKIAVMVLVSVGIWRGRRYQVVVALVPLGLAAYAVVLAYHFGSLSDLGLI